MSRSRNSIINIMVNSSTYLIRIIFSFICRMVFIRMLSEEYLGVNGLFTNLLSMFSLAELGFGTAITYNMYAPISEGDTEKIKSFLNLYKKIYLILAIVISVIGVGMLPFIHYFIKDVPNIPNLNLVYILYLINTVTTYLFGYKIAIINANQKMYISKMIQNSIFVIQNILQMIFLVITKNFIIYLIIQVTCRLISSLILSYKADNMYPYIKDKYVKPLDKESKRNIYNNIKAMSFHRIGNVLINNTDNLIMSKYVGLASVGLYSNYYLVTSSLNSLLTQVFQGFTASIGNLGVESSNEKIYEVYKQLNIMSVYIYGLIFIGMNILFNEFISIWIGNEYQLSIDIVFIISLNFYITGMRKIIVIFRDAMGLFWHDRHKPIFEVLINLVISIILGVKLGMIGVLLGTTISFLLISFWWESYVLFRYCFKVRWKEYFKCYIKYLIFSFVALTINFMFIKTISISGIVGLIVKIILIIFIFTILFILAFKSSFEYITLKKRIKYKINNRVKYNINNE